MTTPGVVNPATDYIVAPSSGLQVSASAGAAFVAQTVCTEGGGNTFYNGVYFVPNDAPTNPYNTVLAPSVNPRIDQVILRVYDVPEQGLGGSSFARVEWLQGSENASASLVTTGPGLSNPGAATLPSNSFRLSYVFQPVGASSISTADIINAATSALPSVIRAPAAVGATSTLTIGQSAIAAPSTTQTLPLPQAGAQVEIIPNASVTGANPVTVSYGLGTGKIFGGGVASAGVTSFLLGAPGISVILEADGNNWYIVSGQQDSGWVTVGLPASWSATAGFFAPAMRLQGDVVRVRGSATNGTGSSAIFSASISAVFNPAQSVNIPCVVSYSSATVGTIGVGGSSMTAGAATANGTAIVLDGVFYTKS